MKYHWMNYKTGEVRTNLDMLKAMFSKRYYEVDKIRYFKYYRKDPGKVIQKYYKEG